MKTRRVLYLGLVALYLLHNDVWFWNRPDLIAGLPIGLLYHVGYCLAVAVVMALLIRAGGVGSVGS